ncbi:MAG TPA: AMP-binding protein, partial [Steroidobacteraceae bacterium]|nr:AMP-binding protein [Steroidobacteraceae bacterium]
LGKFPLMTKTDLRDHYPFGLLAVPRSQILRVHASSGTTGRPTVVAYTRRDLDHWSDLVARSLRVAGARPDDLVQVAFGYGLFTGGLGAHYGAERLGCAVVPMSGGQTERQVQLIVDLQPDILMATPSYALTIAEEFARQGMDARKCSLRIGCFGAEPWTEAMRTEIERAFGIDAVDLYGLSELMGPGVACESAATKDGPILWEDHFYPEIIDPDTGTPLADGLEGELVLTTLTKEALPVIRYRTRDRSRLLPPTSGSMRRLARIRARTDDMMIVRGVNVFPSQIEELILRIPGLAPHYLIDLSRDGHLDVMRIEVEAAAGVDCAAAWRERIAEELRHQVRSYVGLGALVEVRAAGTLERSTGKARRVRDRREL